MASFQPHLTPVKVLIFVGVLASYGGGTWLNQVTEPYFQLDTPHWDPITQALYYVDNIIGYVLKYDPVTTNVTRVYIGAGNVCPILTVEGSNNTLIAGRGRDLISFRWDGVSETPQNVTVLVTLDEQYPENFISGGKADSSGRIWIATSNEAQSGTGGLYLIEPLRNFSVTKKIGMSGAVGMEWNAEDDVFYIVDSSINNITQYDYDAATGNLGNGRVLASGSHDSIRGLVIDNTTQLWFATTVECCAGYVANSNLTTGLSNIFVSLDPIKLTNLAWGGNDSDILFVTSSKAGLTDWQVEFYMGSGALFTLTEMEIHGTPPNKVKLS